MSLTSVRTRTQVNVAARSVTYVAKEVYRVFDQIVRRRGVSSRYLVERCETILKGLTVWLATRDLKSATLEVWDSRTDRLIERYDLGISYDWSGPERYETNLEALAAHLGSGDIPSTAECRVVVDLESKAPDVPGWSKTLFRDTSHLTREKGGKAISTAYIDVELEVWK